MTGVRRAALLAALGGLLALLAGPGVANAAVTATDGQFTYTGTWNTVTGTNHEHWTAQVGATAKINFVTSVAGQTVTLKGVKGVTSGNHTANVVIDASAPAVANEATGTGQTQNATVWTSGAIGVGNHTLTLTVTQAEFSVENLTLTAGSFGGPGYTPPPPPVAACGDGLDNDGDGLVDYPADPGCTSTSDTDETDTTSGTGLPVGDLPGWHQTYAQDFTTAGGRPTAATRCGSARTLPTTSGRRSCCGRTPMCGATGRPTTRRATSPTRSTSTSTASGPMPRRTV
jgi:hypothetical protein